MEEPTWVCEEPGCRRKEPYNHATDAIYGHYDKPCPDCGELMKLVKGE